MSLVTLRMGWRNLGRNMKRTLLAVGAIALGQLTLIVVNSLMEGFFQDILETVTGPMVGHIQIQHADWHDERAVDLYIDGLTETRRAIEALPGTIRVSPRILGFALAASGEKSESPAEAEPGVIAGLDIEAETGRGGLLEGLERNQWPESGEVVVGTVLATRLGVREGQLIAVISQDADGFPVSELYTIKAIVDSKVELIKTLGVVMPIEEAGTLLVMPDQAHELAVYGYDFQEADTLKAAITGIPTLKSVSIKTWREAVPEIVMVINVKKWFDLIFLSIVFIAAAAGIANTAMMSTFERKHEFGMLLAMGSRPRRIINMVVIESVILGLIGIVVGSIIGIVIVMILSRTGFNYAALGGGDTDVAMSYKDISISLVIYPRLKLKQVIYGLIAVTLTSVLASLWPALIAARLEPVEAMHRT